MIESVLQTCWPHHDIICWTLCFANDLIWPSKYKLRCNISNPDCSPMIDLPPWASLVMFIASLLVNIWGELFQHVCQRWPSSISLYIISTLLVYSYVNFLSQITVLTFFGYDVIITSSARIMCYVFYVPFINSLIQNRTFSEIDYSL